MTPNTSFWLARRAVAVARVARFFLKWQRGRRAFQRSGTEPAWLENGMIDYYQRKYSEPPRYGYDAASTARRGERRAETLLRLIPAGDGGSFLEIGCYDGMVSGALSALGRRAVGIDARSTGFDERALRQGARLVTMDAGALGFEDDSFDVAFSFATFEHLDDPDKALAECVRVVKPGGYIYHEFGPTYLAPGGAHLYRQIWVPYCHILFAPDALRRYAGDHGLEDISFDQVNGYSAGRFRQLWRSFADRLDTVGCLETRNPAHADLIARHPSCFKSKSAAFDDFMVDHICVLFRKTG